MIGKKWAFTIGIATITASFAAHIIVMAERNNSSESNTVPSVSSPAEGSVESTGQVTFRHTERASQDISQSPYSDAVPKLGKSVYDFEPEFRNLAIAAVDKMMNERLTQHPNGWTRWRPLVIGANELTNGDYLDAERVAKEFKIEIFPGETFIATQTMFRSFESIAAASWHGQLNGGESGTIEVSVQDSPAGRQLFMKLRTPEGQFTVLPTDRASVYAVSQLADSYWVNKVVSH